MNGMPTSDKQRKYLTDMQVALGHGITTPKRSKDCIKAIKKLLPKFNALKDKV